MSLTSSSFSRRRFLAAIGLVGAGTALAACGGSDSSGGAAGNLTPQQGGNLLIGMPAVSDYLNPLVATTSAVAWASAPVVESLYDYDESMKSVPLLAAGEPEISADGLTWTITLKEGVKFSNGDALTAEHVAAVLKHVSNTKAYSDWTTYFAYSVADAKATDALTVVITLAAPYGILRSLLNNLPIVHKDFIDKTDTTMGTGPFVVGSVAQGQKVELTRNAGYHGEAPALEKVTFTAIPDAATRTVSLRSGEIHVMTDVPPDNVALLKKESAIDVHVVAAPISILSYFNAKKGPFDNVKVRQALAHSMDRAGVNEVVYAGTAGIGQGPAGPALEGHNPDAALYSGTPDVDKAKALLAEAGAGSVEFTLMVSSSSKELTNAAQVLVEGWKQAGITCKLDIIDGGTWISRWMAGDYQMAMSSYSTGVSAGKTAFPLFSTYVSTNAMNYGYANAEVDKLLGQAWATSSDEERTAACKQADALLAADAIAVPPVYPSLIIAQRTDVTALDAGQLSLSRLPAAGAQLMA